jgi:hypothetical protein
MLTLLLMSRREDSQQSVDCPSERAAPVAVPGISKASAAGKQFLYDWSLA